MKGRVKMFNETRGFGFILGEDANDYFVHITDVKSIDPLSRGVFVEFTPKETEKGKVAKDVFLKKSPPNHPAFIDFGNKRIKLGNIKDYGITERTVYFAKLFEHTTRTQKGLLGINVETEYWEWKGKLALLSELSYDDAYRKMHDNMYRTCGWNYLLDGALRYSANSLNGNTPDFKDVTIVKQLKCLHVTTYQKDNYRFYDGEVDFDIFQKYKELDGYML